MTGSRADEERRGLIGASVWSNTHFGILRLDAPGVTAESCGPKASLISRAARLGFPCPVGLVLPFRVYKEYMGLSGDARDLYVSSCAEAVVEEFSRMTKAGACAVRSSANLEDRAGSSMAGQFHTSLNVTVDSAKIARAIVKTYDSVRATNADMAIIVQDYIDADWSGVAFSADPISGDRNRQIVEWTAGAAGVVGHDQRALSRCELDVRDNWPEHSSEGVKIKSLMRLLRDLPPLVDYEQGPIDIEWAQKNEVLYLMQLRPAVVGNIWAPRPGFGSTAEWSDANLRDSFPFVQSPMSWSVLRPILDAGLLSPFFEVGYKCELAGTATRLVDGRVYMNLTAMKYWFWDCFGLRPDKLDEFLGGHQRQLPLSTGRRFRRALIDRLRRSLRLVRLLVKGSARVRVNYGRVEGRQKDESGSFRELIEEGIHRSKRAQLVNFAVGPVLSGIDRLIVATLGEDAPVLYKSLSSGVPSVRMAKGLADLRNTQSKGLLEAFIAEFGHHASQDMDITVPRWSECHEQLVGTEYCREEPAGEGTTVRERLRGRSVRRTTRLRTRVLRKVLSPLYSHAASAREESKEDLVRIAAALRKRCIEDARELVSAGLLEHIEDIFYLTWAELERAEDGVLDRSILSELATDRRRIYQGLLKIPPHGSVIEGEGRVSDVGSDVSVGTRLNGIPISVGQVRGRAYLATDFKEALRCGPDDVLVVASADAGWVPAVIHVKGLVLANGGSLSHIAIACRELGVPAVANVRSVMEVVRTGDILDINGSSGTVVVIAASDAYEEESKAQ